jgi:hypothetical protein
LNYCEKRFIILNWRLGIAQSVQFSTVGNLLKNTTKEAVRAYLKEKETGVKYKGNNITRRRIR